MKHIKDLDALAEKHGVTVCYGSTLLTMVGKTFAAGVKYNGRATSQAALEAQAALRNATGDWDAMIMRQAVRSFVKPVYKLLDYTGLCRSYNPPSVVWVQNGVVECTVPCTNTLHCETQVKGRFSLDD